MEVATLREIFRNYQQWQSLRETDGLHSITSPDGEEIDFLDIQFLYENLSVLPKRQHQAIELYLIQNMRERDAAEAMGISPTNPIGIYATAGLEKLIDLWERGLLPRYRVVLHG